LNPGEKKIEKWQPSKTRIKFLTSQVIGASKRRKMRQKDSRQIFNTTKTQECVPKKNVQQSEE